MIVRDARGPETVARNVQVLAAVLGTDISIGESDIGAECDSPSKEIGIIVEDPEEVSHVNAG